MAMNCSNDRDMRAPETQASRHVLKSRARSNMPSSSTGDGQRYRNGEESFMLIDMTVVAIMSKVVGKALIACSCFRFSKQNRPCARAMRR